MSVFRALVRRELSAFFQGPTGFIIIAAVLFLIGLGFVIVLSGLNGQATPIPVTQVFYSTYFFLADPAAYRANHHHAQLRDGARQRHI